jgi:hypothetical protein
MVDAHTLKTAESLLGDPGRVMSLKVGFGLLRAQQFAESPLINNTLLNIRLKERGRDEGLKNQPASKVDTTHFDLARGIVKRLVERRGVGIGASSVVFGREDGDIRGDGSRVGGGNGACGLVTVVAIVVAVVGGRVGVVLVPGLDDHQGYSNSDSDEDKGEDGDFPLMAAEARAAILFGRGTHIIAMLVLFVELLLVKRLTKKGVCRC